MTYACHDDKGSASHEVYALWQTGEEDGGRMKKSIFYARLHEENHL